MALHLYDRVIKFYDTQSEMSAIHSMSCHSDDNMPENVFNVHVNLSIDTKLFTCEICTYDNKKI